MRVGFDAKRFFNNFTGLGNYSRFIIDALSVNYPGDSFVLYAPRIRSHPEYDAILQRRNVKSIGPSGIERAFKGLWRSWAVSKDPSVGELELFHGLSQEIPLGLPRKVRSVVTVHDLIFYRYPQYYNPIDVAIYKAKVASACKRADRIIAISEQTADDIVNFLKISREKICVVYQGCHPTFKVRASPEFRASVKRTYNLPDRYVLNVGTIETRKNLVLVVKAMSLLPPQDRPKLVVVGRSTAYRDTVVQIANNAGVAADIVFLEKVPFKDLPVIYQMADAFVYPSEFEGFGIPILEAIESGVPVIAATGSCLEEAGGPDTLYTDPRNHEQLADHLRSVLDDTTVRQRMVERSREYARKFSPERVASDLMREYTALLR